MVTQWRTFARADGAPLHTDVKRPEMWPKLNRGKTNEAMSVVLMSLDYVSPAHLAVKKNLTWVQGCRSKAVTKFLMFLKYIFWAFLIVVHQNKGHFWNPETKLDKIGMLHNENFVFGYLTLFDLTLTWPWPQIEVRRKNECFHRILRPKWPTKHVPQRKSHNIVAWLNRWGYT